MSILAKPFRFMLALAIAGAAALAAPAPTLAAVFTVETRATGLIEANPIVLSTLGLGDPGSGLVPFSLYLVATFNTDSPGYTDLGSVVIAPESNVDIDMRVGTYGMGEQRYQNLIAGWANVRVYDLGGGNEGYQLQAGFDPPESSSNSFQITQWVAGPAALIGPLQPLVPHVIYQNPNLESQVDFAAYALNPDAPGAWHMTAGADTFSVEIKTAVPEPGSVGLLGAGLLVLCLWRRRMKG